MDLSAFPYLQGNYAPVAEERDCSEEQLTIEGEIPRKLAGAFMRDGANVAFQPNHYVYPLDGDGMVHAVYFRDGHVHYKNRWVETSHLKTERKFNRMIYGSVGKIVPVPQEVIDAGGEPNPVRNTANTNVLYHGGKLFAMWEGGFPAPAQQRSVHRWPVRLRRHAQARRCADRASEGVSRYRATGVLYPALGQLQLLGADFRRQRQTHEDDSGGV